MDTVESTLTKLGRLLRPAANRSLPDLIEWFNGISDVEEAKEIAHFCCVNTLLGSYSREVVSRAFEASSNPMFQVLADLVRPSDREDVALVDLHLAYPDRASR